MKTIKLASGLEYYRDWERDGYIVMVNPKTVKRYRELFDQAINDLNCENDKDAFKKMFEQTAKECDPQEVYFYEFDNHESMVAWDGDYDAIKVVIDIFGVDVARKVKRYNAEHDIDYILIPQSVKHTWLMLDRLQRDCDYYLGNGNRCAKYLYCKNEEAQIAEMRTLLDSLPEQYRKNCITSEQIDEYEHKMGIRYVESSVLR